MASSSTASQPPPVIQPLPKLHHRFAPGTRVIHRRLFAENDQAILLEYAKNYNVDNAESLNKSALVKVLTTHNRYIPLLPHHSVLKLDGREIISASSSSHDGEGEKSMGKTDNSTSYGLDGNHRDAPPADGSEPSWFKGAISSLKGSKEKVFGAFMGKKVTKKSTKALLENAAAAEYLSDYASGDDEVAIASKTVDASCSKGHAKRPREEEDDSYREANLGDEGELCLPLSAFQGRVMPKRRRVVSVQEVDEFIASVVPDDEPILRATASDSSRPAEPDATSATNPASSSTVASKSTPSTPTEPVAPSTVESASSSGIVPQGVSEAAPHASSSSSTTPPPSPNKRSRVEDADDSEDDDDSKSVGSARKKTRRTTDGDASEIEQPDFPAPYLEPWARRRPMTDEELRKEAARRLKECFMWVPRDEAADEADSDYVPSDGESSEEESESEEANRADNALPRSYIYLLKHTPKAKDVIGQWLKNWTILENPEDCYTLDWSGPRNRVPLRGPVETRSKAKGFPLPIQFSPAFSEQYNAYETEKALRGHSPEAPAQNIPPNRRLKRDRQRVDDDGKIHTPQESPEYRKQRQELKDTLRAMGMSKSFTETPDSPPPARKPSKPSAYWNPEHIDIWTGKPKRKPDSSKGAPSNAKAGSSKAGLR